MGRINLCLKICFVFCNAVIVTIGLLMILASEMTGSSVTKLPLQVRFSLTFPMVYAFAMTAIGCLGVHAGCKEKELWLNIFTGEITAALLGNLGFGFIVVAAPDQVHYRIITKAHNPMFKDVLGVYFGMAALCLLSFIMSQIMIKQIQSSDTAAPVRRA